MDLFVSLRYEPTARRLARGAIPEPGTGLLIGLGLARVTWGR